MEEHYKKSSDSGEASGEEPPASERYVAPGAPIVRTSTPRPMPFMAPAKSELPLAPSVSQAGFPGEAPEAPPLPEEPVSAGEVLAKGGSAALPNSEAGQEPRQVVSEFIWLFEYALEMDPVYLNRPDRLDGSAFAYGPAVLKGYRLAFEGLDDRGGRVVASLVESPDEPEDAEVWGILYRVPRRFTSAPDGETPLLDKIHQAGGFVPLEVQVREPYRQREITCVTYIASPTARQQVSQLPPESRVPEPAYLKRLLQVARRQKLPASYMRSLEALAPSMLPAATALPTTPPEQNTDPLPAVILDRDVPRRLSRPVPVEETPVARVPALWEEHRPEPWGAPCPAGLERWLKVFGLYACLLLLGTLILAIFQGLAFWPEVFNNAFTPLGIPWYVLLYGLLGGCVSCVISLNRPFASYPPAYVVLTWFARPFLGSVLGALAYLVLNSGAILLSSQPAQHFALCSALGALAGLCEGKLLLRKSSANGG